jgi:acyl carrier protein
MTHDTMLQQIAAVVNRLLSDKGAAAAAISNDTQLLGGDVDMDSLDLAMLVRELEDVVGADPFRDGFIEFRTAGELATLYLNARK